MAYFSKKTKQRIMDDYLNATGRNTYDPKEFVMWLKDQPDHEAYKAFWGTSDEELLQCSGVLIWRGVSHRVCASWLRLRWSKAKCAALR